MKEGEKNRRNSLCSLYSLYCLCFFKQPTQHMCVCCVTAFSRTSGSRITLQSPPSLYSFFIFSIGSCVTGRLYEKKLLLLLMTAFAFERENRETGKIEKENSPFILSPLSWPLMRRKGTLPDTRPSHLSPCYVHLTLPCFGPDSLSDQFWWDSLSLSSNNPFEE